MGRRVQRRGEASDRRARGLESGAAVTGAVGEGREVRVEEGEDEKGDSDDEAADGSGEGVGAQALLHHCEGARAGARIRRVEECALGGWLWQRGRSSARRRARVGGARTHAARDASGRVRVSLHAFPSRVQRG